MKAHPMFLALIVGFLPALAALGDAAKIGPDGGFVLFYENGGSLVARRCAKHAPLDEGRDTGLRGLRWRSRCGGHPGDVLRLPLASVPGALRLLLRVPGLYDGPVREAADAYLAAVDSGGVARLGDVPAAAAVGDALDALVADIRDPLRLAAYVFPRDAGGLAFGLLDAFARTPPVPFGFRRIGAGSFRAGSPEDEDGRDWDEDRPVGDARITRPFEMAVNETTQLQYFFSTGEFPSYFRREGDCTDRTRVPVEGGATSGCVRETRRRG